MLCFSAAYLLTHKTTKDVVILFVINVGSFVLHYFLSFSQQAAMAMFYQYFFIALLFLFFHSFQKYYRNILMAIIVFVFLVDLIQIVNLVGFYVFGHAFFGDVHFSNTFNLIRASGIFGFGGVPVFAFINYIGFLSAYLLNKKSLQYLFLFMGLLTFTYKIIGYFLLTYILLHHKLMPKKRDKLVFIGIFVVVISFIGISGFLDAFNSRLNLYVLNNVSARSDSYRVMGEVLSQIKLFGEGLGSFGSSISVKFNSPIYTQYNFNWANLEGVLLTTDTALPIVYVDLGLFFGTLFLLFYLYPLKYF